MSLPAILSAEAEADLDEAAMWYEQQRAGLGVDLVARVRSTLGQIGSTPELYAVIQDDVRRVPVKKFPYCVYYRVQVDRIEVIAIMHDRRDPSVWEARI